MSYTERNIEDAHGLLADITDAKQKFRTIIGLIEARNAASADESWVEAIMQGLDEAFADDAKRAEEVLESVNYARPMSDREIEMMKGIV